MWDVQNEPTNKNIFSRTAVANKDSLQNSQTAWKTDPFTWAYFPPPAPIDLSSPGHGAVPTGI